MKSSRVYTSKLILLSGVLATLFVTGCSHNPTPNSEEVLRDQLAESRKKALEANRRADEAEDQITKLMIQDKSDTMTKSDESGGGLLPPKAKSGECYARVFSEPQYETFTEKRLVFEASEKISVIPAKYQWSEKRVKVEDEHEHLKIVPATYKMVEEKVLVEPARTVKVESPAVYETVTEKVIDKPAHSIWKKGSGPIQKIDEATGEIMCLVEIPATYKNITKRALKKPAHMVTKEIPATYKVVKRRVVDVPEHTVKTKDPAKYETIKVKELVAEEKVIREKIPEKYKMVKKQRKVKDGYLEWRPILCKTNITEDRITNLQKALKAKGYNPGSVDGQIGEKTMQAINSFQKDNNLPIDQYLNIATLNALGI